jgi:hypothetical protein
MNLSTLLHLRITSILSTALGLANASAPLTYEKNLGLDTGNGANQANEIYSAVRTLAGGANETLDLNGVLVDGLGGTVTFTKVKLVAIYNPGAQDLTVGGAATNGFISIVGSATDVIKVKPGGLLLLWAPDANGYGVTAATADQLKIANGAGTSTNYEIIIAGC